MKYLVIACAVLLCCTNVLAHPAPFSYLDVSVKTGELSGRLVVHTIDAAHDLNLPSPALHDDASVARHSRALEIMLTPRLEFLSDDRRVTWSVVESRALPTQDAIEITWRAPMEAVPGRLRIAALLFPYDPNHQTFVNIYERDALVRQEVLNRERTRCDFYTGTRQGRIAVFTSFVKSGIHHIAIGPDHILFIVGLLLLGGSIPRLLAIVTAFTLGHSVTLALATLNIVQAPSSLVEPAIALSIVYVGADNLLVSSGGRDVRPWVALVFGLVHGFGFASVLRETALPDGALALSLFAFNLGVEIGQAGIVVIVATGLGLVRRWNAGAARRLVTVGSVVVMLAGAFWFFERVT